MMNNRVNGVLAVTRSLGDSMMKVRISIYNLKHLDNMITNLLSII